MKKYMLIIVLVLVCGNPAFGQGLAKVGTVGYQFLKIGMDARGQALGDAVGPIVDDARAVFWNPAMLNKVQDWSVGFTHSSYFAEMDLQSFVLAKQIEGIGVVAVFGSLWNSGDIEETTVAQQGGTGRIFQSRSYSFGISYARMLTNKFGIGGNFKYINEDLTNGKLDDDNSTGAWAFDVGSVYYPGFEFFKSLRLVMNIRNFGPEIQLAGTHVDFDNGQVLPEAVEYSIFQMPLVFNFGFGFEVWENSQHKMTFAALLEHPNDNLERGNLGLEYWWNNMISLRGGYVLNHDTRTLSGGVGFQLATFETFTLKLDYAYVDYGVLDMTQFFTMAIDW